jgi:hypothetical protein
MKNMIFGIDKNMSFADAKALGYSDRISPFVVYVSDKETWENEQCSSYELDEEVREKLCNAHFVETMESMFEPTGSLINKTQEELKIILIDLGFEYDSSFEKFMLQRE